MHKSLEQLDKQAKEILETYNNDSISMKERTSIPLQEMPSQDPSVRITNMEEVA